MMTMRTLFTSTYSPNPASARDVLAFVLAPARAFCSSPDELEEVTELLFAAKTHAIHQWMDMQQNAARR